MILFGCVIWVWANVGFSGDMLCILESPNNCTGPLSLERSYVMLFFRGTLQMTRGLCMFLFFSLCTWHGSVRLFWVCPTTRMTFAGTIMVLKYIKIIALLLIIVLFLHIYCTIIVLLLRIPLILIIWPMERWHLTIYIYIYSSWGYPVLPWRNLDQILALYIMLLWVIYHCWDL